VSNLALETSGFHSPGENADASAQEIATDRMSLEEVERTMLVQALKDSGGNQSQAARRLGISRDTLRYRIKKYELTE
jgi:DNA-binding protein Fis